ncbi:unnamed protein product, partial [Ectocarpus sp. 8 AP-2014]
SHTLSPSSHAGTRPGTVLSAVSGGVRGPARLLWLGKRRYVDYFSFQYFSPRKREKREGEPFANSNLRPQRGTRGHKDAARAIRMHEAVRQTLAMPKSEVRR